MKKIILFQVLLIIPLMLFSQAKPFNAKIKSMAIFYTDSGKTVFINPGDSVSLISFDKIKTWKANYQGKKGTVSDVYLLQNKDYLDFRKKYVPIIKPLTPEERKVQIIKKYGAVIGLKIFNQRIWLGMTSAMALASWGEPNKVNRTVGKWGVNEQWVYDDTYLYFENGKLTSWQD
jgi:hypothetical protein